MSTMIEVKNLTKTFKTFKKDKGLKGSIKALFKREYSTLNAVDDISFTINAGEIIGYIGSNGAGKSTTIKMMTGILTPSDGTIIVDGRVPYENRIENAKNIGVVFGQKTQLWWDLPLGETYGILKEIYQIPEDVYVSQMKYFNEVLGINEFMDKQVRTLSLGQRMRADLAASMLHNPKIIYLDEPTIGLDVVVKEKIRKAIKELNKTYGTTIILTTHDMSDIEELSSRILIIDKGRIIYDGNIEKIREEFGYMRKLSFDVRFENDQDVENKMQSFIKEQHLQDNDLNYTVDEAKVIINFNRKKINISHITTFMLQSLVVLDFSIQDMDIETIVKGIYEHENIVTK